MPILQDRWRRYNATPVAHQRRKRAREAASMAGPPPVYPAEAPTSGDWLGGCINGQTVIMMLSRGPRHRCTQWAAWIDGQPVTDAAGLVGLHDMLRARFAKAPSLRAIASMQRHHTARDEAHAAAAQQEMMG